MRTHPRLLKRLFVVAVVAWSVFFFWPLIVVYFFAGVFWLYWRIATWSRRRAEALERQRVHDYWNTDRFNQPKGRAR